MTDDSRRRSIEINVPLALAERLRALGFERGRTPGSLIEESLEAYFAECPKGADAGVTRHTASLHGARS